MLQHQLKFILMKKFVISSILFITIVVLYIITALTFADYTSIYKNFIATSRISPEAVANISYELRKFPTPALIVKEINDNGKIELNNIYIGFSIPSILMFSPKITSLNIENARIHLAHDDVSFISHDEFITELITREALDVQAKIKKLEFVESDLDIPFIINDFYFDGVINNTEFNGNITNIGTIKGSFNYEAQNVVKFYLEVISDNFNAKVVETYEEAILKNGKVEIKSKILLNKIANLIPDLSEFTNNLSNTEEIVTTFDIEKENNLLKFNNLNINSDSIVGKGRLVLSKDQINVNQIEINFSKIDLYSLQKATAEPRESDAGFVIGNNRFDFNKNKMQAIISANKIQLTEHNILTDVELHADIKDNKLNVKKFIGNIDETGKLAISGYVTQNSFRSLFIGQVFISHNDLNNIAEYLGGYEARTAKPIPYTLSSQVKFSTVDTSLQNIIIKTPNNELSGNISVKFIGNLPRINSTLKLNSANIDENNFPIIKKIYNYATSLTENTKDKEYLNKFIPIRKVNYISNMNINIGKLTLNENTYNDFQFSMLLSPGRVKLNDLNIQLGKDYIDMNIDILAQRVKPVVNIKINDGKIGINFLSPSAMLNLRQKILDEVAVDKFDLIFDLYLSEVYQNEFTLNRVILKGSTNDKLLEIKNFDTDIFRGRMQSSGSILLEPLTLNFVYAINSVSIGAISKLIPPGYINSKGAISLSGMWTSNGNSVEELLYNLYTKSSMITKDITVDNFSYDNLIEKANTPEYTIEKLQADLKSALLTGTTNIEDMKSDLELSKGILRLPNIKFKTKYTSGTASATINIYDFSINLDSIFSFMIAPNPLRIYRRVDYIPAKITLKAIGNIFTPKKEADISELEKIIKDRK